MDELLIHGILHLFGFDHEESDDAYDRMDARSRELLALIRETERG
jgi:probable rRNA maturation factor